MAAAVPIVFSEALNVRAACKNSLSRTASGRAHRNEEAGTDRRGDGHCRPVGHNTSISHLVCPPPPFGGRDLLRWRRRIGLDLLPFFFVVEGEMARTRRRILHNSVAAVRHLFYVFVLALDD